ncbi:hypothetical protein BFU36_06710 [Sulfolobus sp. A20]|uniref:hypothetical protein n=1 Tax=Sulfolobaceae TaxID=118883 RepID=UPI000845CD94|nr:MULTISPECIES: hypothetical protein [unclassified Sulfolobus]TRM77099.1 hypothetical protein DJ532_05850 [Sulfolobus sp. A20-N-F8]TRM83146.1 hypothetical protein DJ531_06780 [Sulfolobus sp. A20-N-F6]TRM87648.1 hypothetical protein DJ529_07695 [Sulfolobus sp. C3]TRM91632.1 hypothetical protein DJ526_06655 [Sulfolobus sp. A20-N-G8]TRN00671.1 hypothetical protein DJ530_07020 [Sulfolobus sp. E1]
MEKAIEPWGVNVPYIILGLLYWLLGGIFLYTNLQFHPYFMMIGSYSIFFGMISRLFFPARKYLPLHLTSLILLAIPFYPFQALASASLLATEIWGIKDIRSYGGRFPINTLVLSSPIISLIVWSIFPYNYTLLIVGLMLYLLGINIGVFTATLNAKPKFGITQLPIFMLIFMLIFIQKLLFIVILGYIIWLFIGSKGVKINASALSVIIVALAVSLSYYFLGEFTHAFAFGIMLPFFFSCITYSTSRYNYSKVYPIPYLSALAYFFRFIYFTISPIFTIISILYFIYLFKDNISIETIKLGMSSKYLH